MILVLRNGWFRHQLMHFNSLNSETFVSSLLKSMHCYYYSLWNWHLTDGVQRSGALPWRKQRPHFHSSKYPIHHFKLKYLSCCKSIGLSTIFTLSSHGRAGNGFLGCATGLGVNSSWGSGFICWQLLPACLGHKSLWNDWVVKLVVVPKSSKTGSHNFDADFYCNFLMFFRYGFVTKIPSRMQVRGFSFQNTFKTCKTTDLYLISPVGYHVKIHLLKGF